MHTIFVNAGINTIFVSAGMNTIYDRFFQKSYPKCRCLDMISSNTVKLKIL
jgi:hypothetical protein